MSLAEKWVEYCHEYYQKTGRRPSIVTERAFYAGAQAAIHVQGSSIEWEDDTKAYFALCQEINQFKVRRGVTRREPR